MLKQTIQLKRNEPAAAVAASEEVVLLRDIRNGLRR